MTTNESNDEIDLQLIIAQMRAKGAFCGTGDEIAKIHKTKRMRPAGEEDIFGTALGAVVMIY